MPQFIGRHTIIHGFGREPSEIPPGIQPSTRWGSGRFRLPEGARQTQARLQAEDGAHANGIYTRGGEIAAVVFDLGG